MNGRLGQDDSVADTQDYNSDVGISIRGCEKSRGRTPLPLHNHAGGGPFVAWSSGGYPGGNFTTHPRTEQETSKEQTTRLSTFSKRKVSIQGFPTPDLNTLGLAGNCTAPSNFPACRVGAPRNTPHRPRRLNADQEIPLPSSLASRIHCSAAACACTSTRLQKTSCAAKATCSATILTYNQLLFLLASDQTMARSELYELASWPLD